jgi:hypothetical protein
MTRSVLTAVLAVALAAPLSATARGDRADDDLAAVKKAVGAVAAAEARAEAAPAPSRTAEKAAAAPRRSSSGGPKWLRVRVVEKGQKHGRVSINLPLGLVRAFGEDWPVQGCRSCGEGHGPTLGEILRALDSGQSLVEIEDEDATVRVWVD